MGFISKHKWLITIFSIVFIGLPQYIDSLWGLAEKVSGESMMPNLTWAYGVSVPLAVIMLCITFWATRSEKSKEKNASLLQDIKSDLVAMNTYEREAAVKKAKQSCHEKTAIQIYEDFSALFDMNIATFAQSLIVKVIMNHDIDSLIDFFKTIGDILDANDYGLKIELENNESYQSARLDLAQKRLMLSASEKNKSRIQKNIDRVCSLGYGLNSCILLRGILNSAPGLREQVPAIVRVTLEGIETATETALFPMMNDLEGKLKTTITQTQIQDVIDKVNKMQTGSGLGQSGEMQNEHANN